MDKNDPLTPTPGDHTLSPVLCTATMASLRDEGEEFLLDLVDLFVIETPARLAQLASALEAGDHATAQRAAHTLKSTAAVFGADRLEAVAAATETAARAGEMHEVARLLPSLRMITEEVRLALLTDRKIP
jgi:HPt (histidine-containing phosphotransfer) domain-containing protein